VTRKGLKPYQIALDLEMMGARLLGTVHYPSGDAGIHDGTIADDRVSFRTVHTPQFADSPAEIRFDGTIAGDSLDLILQDGDGHGRLSARRRK
jgi:hypothetical protein